MILINVKEEYCGKDRYRNDIYLRSPKEIVKGDWNVRVIKHNKQEEDFGFETKEHASKFIEYIKGDSYRSSNFIKSLNLTSEAEQTETRAWISICLYFRFTEQKWDGEQWV